MPLDPAQRRSLAAELFNHVWSLLDKGDRTPEEDQRMVHAAHASRFLWEDVGDDQNRSIGEWQVSRVYAVLGRAGPALHHGRLAQRFAERGGLGTFYLAYGHEAIARALAVAGDRAGADAALAQARALASQVADEDERNALLADLDTV